MLTGEYGAAVLSPVLDRISQLAGRSVRLLPVHNYFFEGNGDGTFGTGVSAWSENKATYGLASGDAVAQALAAEGIGYVPVPGTPPGPIVPTVTGVSRQLSPSIS